VPARDRFVLVAGHGSMLLYSLLLAERLSEITLEDLEHFRKWAARRRHPEMAICPASENHARPLGPGHCQRRGHGYRRGES